MLASLARIGPPGDWTWVSFALVAVTFVLLMPLVHAAIVLRSDDDRTLACATSGTSSARRSAP